MAMLTAHEAWSLGLATLVDEESDFYTFINRSKVSRTVDVLGF